MWNGNKIIIFLISDKKKEFLKVIFKHMVFTLDIYKTNESHENSTIQKNKRKEASDDDDIFVIIFFSSSTFCYDEF